MPGFLFGALIIVPLVSLLVWETGSRSRHPLKPWVFLVGGTLFVGVFGMMFLAYRDLLSASEITFIGPFSAAKWWLMFGIWLVPLYFVAIYVPLFNRWILRSQDLEKFNQLVAPNQQTNSKG